MPQYFILMVMGDVFLLLGLILFFWGRVEEKRYYDATATRSDAREYLEHKPQRPEPRALKIGGWIAVAVGLLLLAMGGGFWLWG